MSAKYLHQEIREKGGAYGGGAVASGGTFTYYSYRQGCGSGSGFNDIVDPDPWARKKKKKCTFPQLFKHFYS
jgi:hypothetical protein